jgi:hypothetical protein
VSNTTRRITRVKRTSGDDSRIVIEWQIVHEDGRADDLRISGTDAPRPEMYQALAALAPALAEWLDVTPEWASTLKVTGVSMRYTPTDGGDIMGACVTASRDCAAASPLVLNAPFRPEAPYSEGGDKSCCLTREQLDALDAVAREAELYIDGDRAQMALPLEDAA